MLVQLGKGHYYSESQKWPLEGMGTHIKWTDSDYEHSVCHERQRKGTPPISAFETFLKFAFGGYQVAKGLDAIQQMYLLDYFHLNADSCLR